MKIIKLKNNFKDIRGSITDIFYNKNFKHVSLITSKKNIIRGNNYFKNSATKTIFSNPKIWHDFNNTLEDVEDIEVPSLLDVIQKEGISASDAAKKIDKIWAEKTSPIFKKALGAAESRIRDKENTNQPEKFISDALNKLENLINEDLFASTGKVEFDESILKILQHEDRIDKNYKNINQIRKIAESLKKLLS